MSRLIFLPFFLLTAPTVLGAQPVENPNGSVSGAFGSTEFDAPVLCERAPFVTARTHGANGMPAFEAAILPSGVVSMEIRTDEISRQFGATVPASVDGLSFPVTIAGEIDGIEFSLEVMCPEEFVG
ncbi:hypothetical protein [uncultured Maritimibacter sp.]|nr:hypothetical protein [Maritimibacter sp.]|tara:strand:+ start:39380 stop:39757 length:378 start_codon:yes stop_codon:yes gene_type:complete